jgi:hypothetical protein
MEHGTARLILDLVQRNINGLLRSVEAALHLIGHVCKQDLIRRHRVVAPSANTVARRLKN